jgi:hypothetical protein
VPSTDGEGYSLTIISSFGALDSWNHAEAWRSSATRDGSPGFDDSGDFNSDGKLDMSDVDLYCQAFRSQDRHFDLTGDQANDRADLKYLI